MKLRRWIAWALALVYLHGGIAAAGPADDDNRAGEEDTGSTAAQSVSAGQSPAKLTFADWFSPEYHGIQNTRGNTLVGRAYIPWQLDGLDILSRVTVPFTTSSPGKNASPDGLIGEFPSGPDGFGDIEIYNVAQWRLDWGQISFGPDFSIPTGTHSGVGNGKWTAGPAGGFNVQRGDWMLGAFSQSFFSFAGGSNFNPVAKTKVQPIITWSLGDGWSVGTSDMNFTYDWHKQNFSNLPLGGQVGKSFMMFSRTVKISQQVEYNFANSAGGSAWTLRLTFELPLPDFP